MPRQDSIQGYMLSGMMDSVDSAFLALWVSHHSCTKEWDNRYPLSIAPAIIERSAYT